MSTKPPFTPPYSVAYDMNRRAYLSTIATTTPGSLSGCLISDPSLYTITDRPTLSDDSGHRHYPHIQIRQYSQTEPGTISLLK